MVIPRQPFTTHSARSGIDRAEPADLALARLEPTTNATAMGRALAMIHRARPRWMALAACVGSGIDFTSPTVKARAAALQTCGTCPVMLDCRSWAMTIDDADAVLGGLDPAARRLARKRLATP